MAYTQPNHKCSRCGKIDMCYEISNGEMLCAHKCLPEHEQWKNKQWVKFLDREYKYGKIKEW